MTPPAARQPAATVGSRIHVMVLPQDAPTGKSLGAKDCGPWEMSPRQFVAGHYVCISGRFYRVQAVVHDVNKPTSITVVVSLPRPGEILGGQ